MIEDFYEWDRSVKDPGAKEISIHRATSVTSAVILLGYFLTIARHLGTVYSNVSRGLNAHVTHCKHFAVGGTQPNTTKEEGAEVKAGARGSGLSMQF